MTTKPPSPPPLSASQVADLLDHVIYEQVVACIDLDALGELEQAITMLAAGLDGVSAERAAEIGRAMVDAALRRLPDDVRRYMRVPSRSL